MKLDKAIQILDLYEHAASSIPRDDFLDAIKLGIEALKRCQLARRETSFVGPGPLPGETED